ncbi:patatin family protein [Tieghemostelium lacteum]|uniref:Patatin family protein n=1 Tax=Tieghemostelium lacteum TaxID=361077 RepID=A0A151Z570_TIELA|nr:patatin family protein [Tieghemostelium lacteum]|eukprot:KYQ89085.1 patatin family protein [Tieghemostelium lacteum]
MELSLICGSCESEEGIELFCVECQCYYCIECDEYTHIDITTSNPNVRSHQRPSKTGYTNTSKFLDFDITQYTDDQLKEFDKRNKLIQVEEQIYNDYFEDSQIDAEYNIVWKPDKNQFGFDDSETFMMVSFIGPSGSGKSTLIAPLCHQRNDNSHSFPIPGSKSNSNSTSSDLNFYHGEFNESDFNESFIDKPNKFIIIDSEGIGGSVIPNQNYIHQNITNMDQYNEKRKEAMIVYPKFLYIFSDVLIFTFNGEKQVKTVFDDLIEFSNISSSVLNQPKQPHLVIVFNKSSLNKEFDDFEFSTQHYTDNQLSQFNQLKSFYQSITIISIPNVNERGNNQFLRFQSQQEKLYQLIKKKMIESHQFISSKLTIINTKLMKMVIDVLNIPGKPLNLSNLKKVNMLEEPEPFEVLVNFVLIQTEIHCNNDKTLSKSKSQEMAIEDLKNRLYDIYLNISEFDIEKAFSFKMFTKQRLVQLIRDYLPCNEIHPDHPDITCDLILSHFIHRSLKSHKVSLRVNGFKYISFVRDVDTPYIWPGQYRNGIELKLPDFYQHLEQQIQDKSPKPMMNQINYIEIEPFTLMICLGCLIEKPIQRNYPCNHLVCQNCRDEKTDLNYQGKCKICQQPTTISPDRLVDFHPHIGYRVLSLYYLNYWQYKISEQVYDIPLMYLFDIILLNDGSYFYPNKIERDIITGELRKYHELNHEVLNVKILKIQANKEWVLNKPCTPIPNDIAKTIKKIWPKKESDIVVDYGLDREKSYRYYCINKDIDLNIISSKLLSSLFYIDNLTILKNNNGIQLNGNIKHRLPHQLPEQILNQIDNTSAINNKKELNKIGNTSFTLAKSDSLTLSPMIKGINSIEIPFTITIPPITDNQYPVIDILCNIKCKHNKTNNTSISGCHCFFKQTYRPVIRHESSSRTKSCCY